jgi:hypothetical protein
VGVTLSGNSLTYLCNSHCESNNLNEYALNANALFSDINYISHNLCLLIDELHANNTLSLSSLYQAWIFLNSLDLIKILDKTYIKEFQLDVLLSSWWNELWKYVRIFLLQPNHIALPEESVTPKGWHKILLLFNIIFKILLLIFIVKRFLLLEHFVDNVSCSK